MSIVLTAAVMFLPLLSSGACLATNYEYAYDFYVHNGTYWEKHRLYVSLTSSLYDYYRGKSRDMNGLSKFVTPRVFRSIAENIWDICKDKPYSEEQFANAVLMITHQIRYGSVVVNYPVETLVENTGDCDTLSYLAASIMKAGGLDVVLFYYKGLEHVNLGVYLSREPVYHTPRMAVTYYEHNSKEYYVAECTSQGTDPRDDWKIGDCQSNLAVTEPLIIPLENCEMVSPAQVSSRLDEPLIPSSISLTLSPTELLVGDAIMISGSIFPAYPNREVEIYMTTNGYSWNLVETLTTDSNGRYIGVWNPIINGACYVKASWSGYGNHSGAESENFFVTVSMPPKGPLNITAMSFAFIAITVTFFVLIGMSIYETVFV